MTTAALTGTDLRLRTSVLRELDWDPEVDDSAIGVSAKDGVVTLTGFIDTYAGKLAAERVAKRVRGVRAVANDITVRPTVPRTDADIAVDATRALKMCAGLPDHIQVAVHQGHLTLTGRVEWYLQKESAGLAMRGIRGVRGVFNRIEVATTTTSREVQRHIVQSLHRNADVDARHIHVAVTDDTVTLTGTVGSWAQRDAAERGAGCAPGIRQVDNRIVVVPQEPHELEPVHELL